MKNYQKPILICLAAIALCFGLFFAWQFYTTVKRDVKPVLSAVPTDCMVLLRVNNSIDLLSYVERQHTAIAELFDLDPKGSNTAIIKALKYFESKIRIDDFWFSTHFRNNQTNYLLLFNVDALQQRVFGRFLNELKNEDNKIIAFEIDKKPVFGGFSDGIFIASFDYDLLQEALNQIGNTPNLLNDAALEKVLNSAGKNVPANLFIQVPELAKSLQSKVNSDYAILLKTLGLFSKWIEYDLIERTDRTLLTGYAVQSKSETFFLDLLAYKTPEQSTIANVLPSTTRFFFNLNVENFPEFYEQFQMFLDEYHLLKPRDSALNSHSENLAELCKETFSNCISQELSYFSFLDGYGNMRIAIVFQYDDLNETRFFLQRLLNYSPPHRGIEQIDKIHRLHLPNLLPNSLFGFFPRSSTYFFAMIGHHIFFATEEETLLHIRMFFDQQKVLSKTVRMHNFSAQMQDEANLNIYVQDLRMIFRKAPNVACGLQFSGSKGIMYAHAYLQSNAGREREYDQLEIAPKKATPADKIRKGFKGNVLHGAFQVNNHRVKNEPFYLLQDDKFVMYYLDKNGKILWKRQVDGVLKSGIEEVDYLKNQKIQYRFQTEKQTYILDIFGRNVGNYPKKN
jgi:hypothetical protein